MLTNAVGKIPESNGLGMMKFVRHHGSLYFSYGRSNSEISWYRSNSENTYIFLGFGGSRYMVTGQLSVTQLVIHPQICIHDSWGPKICWFCATSRDRTLLLGETGKQGSHVWRCKYQSLMMSRTPIYTTHGEKKVLVLEFLCSSSQSLWKAGAFGLSSSVSVQKWRLGSTKKAPSSPSWEPKPLQLKICEMFDISQVPAQWPNILSAYNSKANTTHSHT